MKRQLLVLVILIAALPLEILAQASKNFLVVDCNANDHEVGELAVEVDAMAFFRDNEYDCESTRGYSLPGAWIRPKVTYNPTANIHMEAGAHGLFFDGANKYPNYVYHDIGTWKGNQYQHGAHMQPWLRLQMDTENTSFVLGDIYGDLNHCFSAPMYNHEQVMSADPEMGFQILHSSRWFTGDLFLNWQSYQFKEDTHQEAFTVGLSGRVGGPFLSHQNNEEALQRAQKWHFFVPVQLLIQHRGGEQDQPQLNLGVQTIANASVAVAAERRFTVDGLWLMGEAGVLGCYQQSGHLWPFDSGIAYHAMAKGSYKDFKLMAGYFFAPKNFVSLYGAPFFSTLSTKTLGERYDHRHTAYLQFDYSHTFAKNYTLGANLDFFHTSKGNSPVENVFSFGVYMRVTPKFLIRYEK